MNSDLLLVVGLLLDDATVEIENIHRNLAQGKPVQRAILDGAQQIAVPAFVSTLAISIVFVSVVFLTGPAKCLFTPLALAVVFAMPASYLLSRTLVPVMVKYLIRSHKGEKPMRNLFTGIQQSFEKHFENFRQGYVDALAWSLQNRATVFALFGLLVGSALVILPVVGRDFFPQSMPASSVCT
jgi:multidrug efflux pump subunit AcrB